MLAGAAVGCVVGLVFATAAVYLYVNQIILGLALYLTGIGLSTYLGDALGLAGTRSPARLAPVLSGGVTDWPLLGPVVFDHDIVAYLTWLVAAAASFYLYKTRPGLAARAVGDDPQAADTVGVRVGRTRVLHVIVGSSCGGLGGAYISLALIPAWTVGLTAGAGWIALALVIVGSWRPWRVLLAAYLFGATTRLAFTLQVRGVGVPSELLNMLPFVLAFLALVAISISSRTSTGSPKSLGRPYIRGS
jgi:simple sugar transport system permease protein